MQKTISEHFDDQHWRDFLAEAKRVFPGIYVSSVQITKGDTMAFFKFSKEDVDEQQGFELLPAAKYIAVVMDSEWKTTKDNTGHYLALTFEIIGPEFTGRKIFENYNLDNASKEASQIAARQFRDFCDAIEARQFCDEMYAASSEEELQGYLDSMPEAIFNQPVEINVGVQKSKDPQYGDNNKIKAYASVKKMETTAPKWKK